MNTMDVSSSAQVSVGRNRLKTIARLVAGISVLCMMGGSGYFVYEKVILFKEYNVRGF